MERIAGDCGFLPETLRLDLGMRLDFEFVSKLRTSICPSASERSFLFGVLNAWPTTAILVRAQYALKVDQQRQLSQATFAFREPPKQSLRAVEVSTNLAALEAKHRIHKNMRVPENSVIHRVLQSQTADSAIEDLSWCDQGKDGSVSRKPR
jgi:hypothetical protein